jgi:uncharacterized membrane protein
MFCSKCGQENGTDAKFCISCGIEIVNKNEEINKFNKTGKYSIDEEGFVRKSRNDMGILYWAIGGVISIVLNKSQSEYDAFMLILWPIAAYFLYLAIKNYSSHDIETWKYSSHTKLWIYVGSLFAGLVGIIVYYYLKGKEREYIAKNRAQFA